jgi:hypothetical protein
MLFPQLSLISEIEGVFFQIIILFLLVFGGARILIHELTGIREALREFRRSGECPTDGSPKVIPNLSP